MNKKIIIIIGVIGSIASIVGLVSIFTNPPSSKKQVQSGNNNVQAGNNIIINHNNSSTYTDGIFLFEEQLEPPYWNEWFAHPLISKKHIEEYGQADVTVRGEGKTVDFLGTLSMNCSNGMYYWKSVSNFDNIIEEKSEINSLVPKQVIHNINKIFCQNR